MKKWGKFCSILCMLIFTVTLLPINAFGEEITEDTVMYEQYDELSVEESYDCDYNGGSECVYVLQNAGPSCWCGLCEEIIRRTFYIHVEIGVRLILTGSRNNANESATLILLENGQEQHRGTIPYTGGGWVGSIQYRQPHVVYGYPCGGLVIEDGVNPIGISSWRIELPTGVRSHRLLEDYFEELQLRDSFFIYEIQIGVERYDSNEQNGSPPNNDNNYNNSQSSQRPPSPQTGDSLQVLPSLMNLMASIILLRFWCIKRKEK